MNIKFFKLKNFEYKNKFIAIIFFILFFIYIYNFTLESAKGYIVDSILVRNSVVKEYGLWGYLINNLYKFLDILLGKWITNINLVNIILAFQVASLWSILIYKISKFLNYYSLIIFFSPFVLNYFAVCTRDAIALGLFLIIMIEGFNRSKLIITIFISLFIHKGLLPLIFTNTLINKFKNKSKKVFLSITFFSIITSLVVNLLLRHTDIASYIPNNFYGHILSFPRYGVLGTEEINVEFFGERNIAYNFNGNFNLKILSFGVVGQIISIFFKNKFNSQMFCIYFSVFFVCTVLSTIPNADRFIYHAVLLSGPAYLDLAFIHIQKAFLKIKNFSFN